MKSEVDLLSVMNRYGTDENCRAYLTELRWPDGVKCPKCQSDAISAIRKRNQYDCDSCRYQFSVLSGTMFHDTHLPLTKWFFATYLMCESRKGMSANQIKRMLRIGYETSWYLCHRIRAAMKEVNKPDMDGVVEVDETFVGGKPRIGRPHRKKEVVVGVRQRDGELRFTRVGDVKANTLYKVIHQNVSDDVEFIITDDFSAYDGAMGSQFKDKHVTINHSQKQYSHGWIYTNTVESAFSLLKRGIIGTWHKVSAKHLPAYLDEMCWRFNNRKNQYLFRDTLLKMLEAEHVEYKVLTAAA